MLIFNLLINRFIKSFNLSTSKIGKCMIRILISGKAFSYFTSGGMNLETYWNSITGVASQNLPLSFGVSKQSEDLWGVLD